MNANIIKNEFKKMTFKDIQNSLEVSECTAKKILKDIKNEYDIKIVTYRHLKMYLKV